MAQPVEQFSVLGIGVNLMQISEVIARMQGWIAQHGECRTIAVTGMHGIMEAHHDQSFKNILNSSSLVVPDGMPLVWLARLKGHRLKRRVYGPDLMMDFCEISASKGYRHFLYGGAPRVAEKLASELTNRFPGLVIAGTYSPPFRPVKVALRPSPALASPPKQATAQRFSRPERAPAC